MEITDKIVDKYQSRVEAIATGMCDGDSFLRDDLMQEAWVKIIEDAEDYEGKAEFGTWVSRVAINAMKKYFRDKEDPSLAYAPNEDLAKLSHKQGEEFPDPAAIVEGMQTVTHLTHFVAGMEPDLQRVVRLTMMDTVSAKDAAELMSVSVADIRNLTRRAKRELLKFQQSIS